MEFFVSLSSNYPKEKPEVYARSSTLNRTQQLLLNRALSDLVKRQQEDEPCIYALISWLQDNGEDYLATSSTNTEWTDENKNNDAEDGKSTTFARYWIYSHHIYSKFKRKEVVSLARENNLTGFCVAGKPGIICVEGTLEDCDYYWQKVTL